MVLYIIIYIYLSAGSDNKIIIWNVGTAEAIMEMELPDVPLSASWSYSGSLFAVSCKDRKLRVVDPRVGSIIQVCIIKHICMCIWLASKDFFLFKWYFVRLWNLSLSHSVILASVSYVYLLAAYFCR
jgi:WD40 repeat protein